MSLTVGVSAAVGAGACFAAAGVLQQRAAARTRRRSLSVGLVASLARQPLWLTGIGLAAASYGLQALALSAAPLAVVQPLLVIELVFAVPVSAGLYGQPLRAREWTGIVAVASGLAITVWSTSVARRGSSGVPVRWGVGAGVLVAAALILAVIGRRRGPLARASLYAAAAALVFALSSTLLAATVQGFTRSGVGGLTSPAPYGMAASNLLGLVLIQSAFQAGPLAVIMPMMDWVEPLVAVLLGVSVLGESLNTSPGRVAALLIGAVAALGGIVALDTSPRVRSLQRTQALAAAGRPARSPGQEAEEAAATACLCRAARLGRAPYPADDDIDVLTGDAPAPGEHR